MKEKFKAGEITDVHCHILPGVDDGSRSMEETLQMLSIAEQEGIRSIICTPHYRRGGSSVPPEILQHRLEAVQREIVRKGIRISLYLGNEIMYFTGIEEAIEKGNILTMNQTNFLLVEFMPQDSAVNIRNSLEEVFGMGYIPVLAHVERYECMLREMSNVEQLHDAGVKIQINAASVTGAAGIGMKRFVHKLLKKELVDYIGTDAHRSDSRIPAIKKCCEILYKKYDSIYIDGITGQNARRDFFLEN